MGAKGAESGGKSRQIRRPFHPDYYSVPRPHDEGNNYLRQHLHLTGVGDSIWAVSLHSKERQLGPLVLEVLHVIPIKGGKGEPDLSTGLGHILLNRSLDSSDI